MISDLLEPKASAPTKCPGLQKAAHGVYADQDRTENRIETAALNVSDQAFVMGASSSESSPPDEQNDRGVTGLTCQGEGLST